jgi:hypothetical protein
MDISRSGQYNYLEWYTEEFQKQADVLQGSVLFRHKPWD